MFQLYEDEEILNSLKCTLIFFILKGCITLKNRGIYGIMLLLHTFILNIEQTR